MRCLGGVILWRMWSGRKFIANEWMREDSVHHMIICWFIRSHQNFCQKKLQKNKTVRNLAIGMNLHKGTIVGDLFVKKEVNLGERIALQCGIRLRLLMA